MSGAERHLNHLLESLRAVIGRRGFSHGEIEESLGWGGGRTEKLLARREAIDVEEVAAILNVIGVEPADFFGEVFPPGVARADASGVGKDADG